MLGVVVGADAWMLIITSVKQAKVPALPKGVPAPPPVYTIYLAHTRRRGTRCVLLLIPSRMYGTDLTRTGSCWAMRRDEIPETSVIFPFI